jgi:hypothetical protein
MIQLRGEQTFIRSPRTVQRQFNGLPDRFPIRLGGDHGSALGTAAGKDLPAVGGSHSLSEAMDFGSVTLSGLIGTQHVVTPPMVEYAQQL